jgi:hypothetical protein
MGNILARLSSPPLKFGGEKTNPQNPPTDLRGEKTNLAGEETDLRAQSIAQRNQSIVLFGHAIVLQY